MFRHNKPHLTEQSDILIDIYQDFSLSIATNSASYLLKHKTTQLFGELYFGEKTVKFQLGMGPFTGPACKGYYVLNDLRINA